MVDIYLQVGEGILVVDVAAVAKVLWKSLLVLAADCNTVQLQKSEEDLVLDLALFVYIIITQRTKILPWSTFLSSVFSFVLVWFALVLTSIWDATEWATD